MNIQGADGHEVLQRKQELENEECSGRPSKVYDDRLRAIIKADSLLTTWEVDQELNVSHSMVIWSKLEMWKSLISGCLMTRMKILKKNHLFEVSSSLILRNNQKPFLNQFVICDEKWILYYSQQWPVQQLNQEEAPKHFPKPNFHPKKVHGHSLVVCYPSDPLQLSESQWNHYIWEVRWANQWDAPKTSMPADRTGQQKGVNSFPWQCPTTHRTINTSKVERIGLQSFVCHIHLTSWQPTTTSSRISKTFCRKNTSTTSRMQKMLSKSSSNSEAHIFMLQE